MDLSGMDCGQRDVLPQKTHYPPHSRDDMTPSSVKCHLQAVQLRNTTDQQNAKAKHPAFRSKSVSSSSMPFTSSNAWKLFEEGTAEVRPGSY